MSASGRYRFDDRIALITGAASRNNQAVAKRFAAQWDSAAAFDRDVVGLSILKEQLSSAALVQVREVMSGSGWAGIGEGAPEMEGRLDIPVNKALAGIAGSVAMLTLEAWRAGMALNCGSVFLGSHTLSALRGNTVAR